MKPFHDLTEKAVFADLVSEEVDGKLVELVI